MVSDVSVKGARLISWRDNADKDDEGNGLPEAGREFHKIERSGSDSRSSKNDINFTLNTSGKRELRAKLINFPLLPIGPGNHSVRRIVMKKMICGFLIGRTLESSRFRPCSLECVPGVRIRVAPDV